MNYFTNGISKISAGHLPQVGIRLITEDDIELLREWKNANRNSFFYKQELSKIQQKTWFSAYLERENDYMFIASLDDGIKFGCLGCRYVDDKEWDIYNVINGDESTRRKGYMAHAIKKVIDFCNCRHRAKISLNVLNTNPARYWYIKNGFIITHTTDSYCRMEYDVSKLD
jgi:RimJ/RimL family protein N-acetyltransferase